MKDAQSLFAKMYEQAGGGTRSGRCWTTAGAGADSNATYNSDDVVDAALTKKCRLIKRVY